MIWLKRLFNAPLLLKLRWDHSGLVVKIQEMQKALYRIIDLYGREHSGPCEQRLQELCEEMADLDARMKKLWSSGSDSKNA